MCVCVCDNTCLLLLRLPFPISLEFVFLFLFFATFSVCIANILMAISCPFDYDGYIAIALALTIWPSYVYTSIHPFIHSFICRLYITFLYGIWWIFAQIFVIFLLLASIGIFFFWFPFFILSVYCQSSVLCSVLFSFSLVLSIKILMLGIYFDSWLNSRIFIENLKYDQWTIIKKEI